MTVLPLTVQTPGVAEVNTTGLPDAPPVAVTVPVPPTLTVGVAPKLIAWLTTGELGETMLNVNTACGAAV